MSVFGNTDAATSAPKNKDIVVGNGSSDGPNRGNAIFANTTFGAFVSNTEVGLYGVDTADVHSYNGSMAHTGWVIAKRFSGPVVGFTINTAGHGYVNNDPVVVTGVTGSTNATGNVVTNSTGNVVAVTLITQGSGFVNGSTTTATINSVNVSATGATVAAVLGGRANRVQFETLQATGSITGNTYLP